MPAFTDILRLASDILISVPITVVMLYVLVKVLSKFYKRKGF